MHYQHHHHTTILNNNPSVSANKCKIDLYLSLLKNFYKAQGTDQATTKNQREYGIKQRIMLLPSTISAS